MMMRKSMMVMPADILSTPRQSSGSSRYSLGPRRLSNAFGNAIIPAASRQSMGPRSNSGMMPLGATAQPMERIKDPRNIREPAVVKMNVRTLFRFLSDSRFPGTLSETGNLLTPSAKDFQNIFMFLYHHIDRDYEVSTKFEDEVPQIVKALRYVLAAHSII